MGCWTNDGLNDCMIEYRTSENFTKRNYERWYIEKEFEVELHEFLNYESMLFSVHCDLFKIDDQMDTDCMDIDYQWKLDPETLNAFM